jgi:thiamine phosphate synthase YjbQ (UPF0047 family)
MQELKMEVTISLRQNDKNIKQDKEKRIYRYIPLDKRYAHARMVKMNMNADATATTHTVSPDLTTFTTPPITVGSKK